MEKSYTQSSKSIDTGFLLNEQELRRIIEVINEQFEKTESNKNLKITYIIENANGQVIETTSLEYIINYENIGPSEIVTLTVEAIGDIPNEEIKLTFSNTSSEKSKELNSIRYKIKSENRDWALVSSSLFDDRINKIVKSNFVGLKVSHFISAPLFIFLSIILFASFSSLGHKNQNLLTLLNNLEKKIQQHQNVDVLSSIVKIEKVRMMEGDINNTLLGKLKYLVWFMIPSMMLFFFTDSIESVIAKYFPNKLFFWGDYIEKHNKMIKRRNLILGFVFVTVIIGIVINILSNFLWTKMAK
ncbi:hypothetical protein F0919_13555 [Taibaiella lutea]|uniref:Uncharacterized protein n=1 Tax=Taibaiella lutea TaxID=2608001 RepID=A0A5M6CGK0_9BACT|nr:hypothetical protein [Taibaiella lutea]KAA5533560.1 hypothetical protein F0919_13555 [Taibaiella lutea]